MLNIISSSLLNDKWNYEVICFKVTNKINIKIFFEIKLNIITKNSEYIFNES